MTGDPSDNPGSAIPSAWALDQSLWLDNIARYHQHTTVEDPAGLC
jgi:hypothetical protein